MPLWGATDADESKPKNLTTAQKKQVFANASGWVLEAGSALSGNDNTDADPEIVKNGRAKNAIDVTNYKEPSKFSQAKDKVIDFTKKNPVAALATYDIGKGILGKLMKVKGAVPGVVGGTVGRRSARGGGGL